ncbi:MAG: DUF4270 family protein [Candidatus Competibacteraceae bacterium]|nr:DUF4270 family protein [Candidatus Competibacteraceae bacterium]
MKGNRLIVLMFSVWFFSSCQLNENPDPGVIPPEDLLNAQYSDTTQIVASVLYDDTVRTDNAIYYTVGSNYDPVFGKTRAAFYTTVNVAQSYNSFGSNPVLDSVVLILRFRGTYGDAAKLNGYQTIEVFELQDDLPVDSTEHNSFTPITYYPTPLATQGFVPIFVSYPGQGTQMRIRLNQTFGQRFLNADSLTASNIRSLIKGFYVRIAPWVTQGQTQGQGAIVFFDLRSEVSRLSVYFHNDQNPGGLEIKMLTTGSGNERFNEFSHDYSFASSELATKLSDPNDQTVDKLFLQSGQGLRIKLGFPNLMNYATNQKIIINKAELIIPVDESQDYQHYPAPLNITSYTLNADRTYNLTDDFQFTYYDSFYDEVKKQYRVLLTQHFQQIMNGEYPVDELYIDAPILSKNTDVNRVVLHGPNHPLRPMKLHLVYTPIQTP